MTEEKTPEQPQLSGAASQNGQEHTRAPRPRRESNGAQPQGEGGVKQSRPQGSRPPRPRPAVGDSTGKPPQPGQPRKQVQQGQSAGQRQPAKQGQPARQGQQAKQGQPAGQGRPAQQGAANGTRPPQKRPGDRAPQAGDKGVKTTQASTRPAGTQSRRPGAPQGQRPSEEQRAQGQTQQVRRPPQGQPRPGAATRPARPAATQQGARPKPAPKPVVPEEPEELLLQYTAHEFKRSPKKAAIVVLAIAAVAYLGWTIYPDPISGVIGAAIMTFSVSAFLFPIRYKFTSRGVYFRNLASNEFRTWGRFYDYTVYKDAIQLLFDYRTLRGRVQKGFLVYFSMDQSQRDKLLEIVQSKIKKPEKVIKPSKESTQDAEAKPVS